jgi:hypothetical protein
VTQFAALLTLAAALLSQPQPTAAELAAQPAPVITLQPTEIDAVGWALGALAAYPADAQPFVRFVWIPPWGSAEWQGVVDFSVNAAVSHARTLYRGDRHANGWLLAYDLRRLAGGDRLAKLVETWDEIALRDPYFHVTESNVEVIPSTSSNSSRSGSSSSSTTKRTRKVAILAPHLSAAIAQNAADPERSERIDVLVTQLTRSTGAIYRADWFLEQLLTSDVGRYPEFRQIEFAATVQGESPLQTHLARAGFSIEDALDAGGEKACWVERSGVTGKERIVLAVFGPGSRTPLVSTFDLNDATTRSADQFSRNLVNFAAKSQASELFVPLPNGLVEYLLTDGAGNFQRTAPDFVVSDSTKPDGFTSRLEMGMSCIVCHHPDNGYKTAKNDLDYAIGSDVDFVGEDVSIVRRGQNVKLTRQEVVDLVAGRYAEGLLGGDNVLARSRRDYELAVARITDYEATADGLTGVQQLGVTIQEIYHDYRYGLVDAERICLELGVRVADGVDPLPVLRQLVPAPAAGTVVDPKAGFVRNGLKLNRHSYEVLHADFAAAAAVTRGKITEVKK